MLIPVHCYIKYSFIFVNQYKTHNNPALKT